MFILNTTLYTVLTIVFVPALIVLAYMMLSNAKYKEIINIYGISGSGISSLFTVILIGYIFLTGLCVRELSFVWTSTLFLGSLACSAFIAVVICRILRSLNRDRIQYGNIVAADEAIQDKIMECSAQLDELKKTLIISGISADARWDNNMRLEELRETLGKLTKMHQELQQQKIMMNASLGAREMKGVMLGDNKEIARKLDRNVSMFEMNRKVNSNFRGIEDIIKKYSC